MRQVGEIVRFRMPAWMDASEPWMVGQVQEIIPFKEVDGREYRYRLLCTDGSIWHPRSTVCFDVSVSWEEE